MRGDAGQDWGGGWGGEAAQVRRRTGQGLLTAWLLGRGIAQPQVSTVYLSSACRSHGAHCILQARRDLAGKKPASLTVEPFYFLKDTNMACRKV